MDGINILIASMSGGWRSTSKKEVGGYEPSLLEGSVDEYEC
jgi:hypothetical protein